MHISIFDSLRHFQTSFLQVSVVIFAIIANLQHFSNFIKNKFENRLCKPYRLLYYFFRLNVDNIILCITSCDTCHHQYNHMRFVSFIYHMYMSTENSVNRSLKTRSLLTKFGTCSITATGAVTI